MSKPSPTKSPSAFVRFDDDLDEEATIKRAASSANNASDWSSTSSSSQCCTTDGPRMRALEWGVQRNIKSVFFLLAQLLVMTYFGYLSWYAADQLRELDLSRSWPETRCLVSESPRVERKCTQQSNAEGTRRRRLSNAGCSWRADVPVAYSADGLSQRSATAHRYASTHYLESESQAQQLVESCAVGDTVPCWYNPNDLAEVTLTRADGPRGGLIFSLVFYLILSLCLLALFAHLVRDVAADVRARYELLMRRAQYATQPTQHQANQML